MPALSQTQIRLVYSLLKPVVRAAARFHVPMRTLSELLRLAYFEVLRHEGLSQAQIGRRLGQTERHMRSLAQKLKSDFFAAEREIGVVREVENTVAGHAPRDAELPTLLPAYTEEELKGAVGALVSEQRIRRDEEGRLRTASRYILLASERFHHRIDALNHFLDGTYRAALSRLVFDEQREAMIKTISFTAVPEELHELLRRLEGDLRQRIAELEERASFEGDGGRRYSLGLAAAPHFDDGAP